MASISRTAPAAAAALLAAAVAARALPAWFPEFGDEAAVPSAGVAFAVMSGAVQLPAPPPEIRIWKLTRGSEEWTEERADATELWRTAQTMGTWRDSGGNILVAARAVSHLPPALAEAGDIAQQDFERFFSDPGNALAPGSTGEEIAPWIERFTGLAVSEKPQLLELHPSRFAKVWEFRFSDGATLAWAVRLNAARRGAAETPREWFVFALRLAAAPRPAEARETVRVLRRDLVGSLRAYGLRRAEAERERTPIAGEGEPLEDERRRQARASVEALDDWWYMESEHYILLSDAPGGERRADALLSELEALRPYYKAAIPPFERTVESSSVIRVFRNDEDYVAYLSQSDTGLDPAATAGIFSSARRELVIRPARRGSTIDAGAVARHEGFHQYVFAAWGGVAPSIWFNEGYAEFFASFRDTGGGSFEWAETKSEIDTLERLANADGIDWTALLHNLVLWDQATFYNPPFHDGAATSYALAYGIAYFLERGAPFVRNKPYRDIVPKYVETMERTGDPLRATAEAFRLGRRGDDTAFLAKFARDMREFFRSSSARRNARRLQPVP